ncbi:cache domain-containing protein [Motiliproteus sp. SC1-56]|uniref:cache domain-containing protein n=1 Tax=Motiliproteus sp. SC1-56 TaxID=2799565 RepID=UPI001A8C24E3|nr:cache domain-containing protein [Motiliproteus sp. SC1-56]
MFGSKLVQRFFSVIVVIVAFFSLAVYLYSVPLIKSQVYQIERNASRIALNNVFELANKIYFNLEAYRAQALASHKAQLQTVVSLAEAYTRSIFDQVDQGLITEAEARRKVFDGLRHFTYGNNDYIWVSGYDAKLLSHPDPRFHGTDASSVRSQEGDIIIPRVVEMALRDGEGFYQYKWRRLGGPREIDKISYVKNFPEWGFVIGSGLYLDDIEAEVAQRKQAAIQELRSALAEIRIAKTGYLYIFDADYNMLVHPNPNIDGTDFSALEDPVTGESIADELIAVADTGRELRYKWDRPSDPNNYVYDKLSLVRHLEGFDWYIGSSVYEDELRASAELLSERIMTIALVTMGIAILLAYVFVNKVTSPINRLVSTAVRVRNGDLTAQSGIERDDELGVLARTFDAMVERLSSNIQTLDQKVQERTQALELRNTQLGEAVASEQQAREELAAIEERQRMILDALPAQIAYVGSDLRYRFVNQGYATMFRGEKEDIVGRPVAEVMGAKMFADIKQQVDLAMAGKETVYEYVFDTDGQEVITKRILIPYKGPDGQVDGMLNLSLDITAEKEAERKLTEAQRMSAVGQLAGGLAHDFNNLLTVVLGNLLSARERHPELEELDRYLAPAIRASRRGADITGRLLAFSRRQALTPTAINVDELIGDCITLLKGSLPSNIKVSYRGENGCAIFADPSQLENALVNLALNARDAMPRGGELNFATRARRVDWPEEYDEIVLPGDYVEIEVCDTGVGFSEEGLLRAFEPFFTTKSGGAGSGLGLSMVYGFVKQSSGYIRLQSEPGEGTRVALLLPVATQRQGQADEEERSIRPDCEAFDGKLMLLVEDDPDVREVVRLQLAELGLAVIEAADGDEALALARSLNGLYAMLSDVMMPGSLDGFELAEKVATLHPAARIVLMTGYTFDQSGAEETAFPVLRKPFEREALRRALLTETRTPLIRES